MEIHQKIVELIDAGRSFALAVILRTDGSAPQKAGVKAIIEESGRIAGTLGGGFVEADTQRRAAQACRSKRPVVFDFLLDEAYARDAGPICGGNMRILIDPTVAGHRECYLRAADALRRRARGVLLTSLRTASQAEAEVVELTVRWFPQDAVPPDAGFPGAEAIRSCLQRERPRLFVEHSPERLGHAEVFVEPVIPKPRLLIAGGGHVGQALALQAIRIGFEVTVIDDRAEFTRPDLFPDGVTARCGDIVEELAARDRIEGAYIVIVTRGHKHDAEGLQACIHSAARYIGMIGSRRKVELIREDFIRSGLATAEEFGRVFAPIGLDVGAVTVEEIATSIAAQLIEVRRKGGHCTPPEDTVQK